MPFMSNLVVKELEPELWEVREDLHYEGSRERLTVPAGTQTNFASVPKLLRWLIPKYGKYNKSTVLHDWLCVLAKQDKFNRADADGIFRRSMRESRVGYVRRRLMWAGVRWGGKLKGASFNEALAVIIISLLALPIVLPGLIAAQILIWAYQLLEFIVYALRVIFKWIFRRPAPSEAAPKAKLYWAA